MILDQRLWSSLAEATDFRLACNVLDMPFCFCNIWRTLIQFLQNPNELVKSTLIFWRVFLQPDVCQCFSWRQLSQLSSILLSYKKIFQVHSKFASNLIPCLATSLVLRMQIFQQVPWKSKYQAVPNQPMPVEPVWMCRKKIQRYADTFHCSF